MLHSWYEKRILVIKQGMFNIEMIILRWRIQRLLNDSLYSSVEGQMHAILLPKNPKIAAIMCVKG